MTETLANNTVYLTGTVESEPLFSHKVFEEGFYETTLKISRLSDQSDYIPITVSDRLMESVPLTVGKTVSIIGQFRSYNKVIDNHSKLMLTVFVRDICDREEESFEKNPNQIDLIGFICKEPIYRTTPFKREICDILVAVNRAYNKSDYIPCIAWGRNARFVSSLDVGTKITLSGRIQSREYQKQLQDGTVDVRTAYEISVNRVGLAENTSVHSLQNEQTETPNEERLGTSV